MHCSHGYLVMIGLISQYTVLKISTIRGRGWLFTHLMHYVEQISYLLNDFTVDKHLHSEILLIIKDCSIFFNLTTSTILKMHIDLFRD